MWAQQSWTADLNEAVLKADWLRVTKSVRQGQQGQSDSPIANWLLGYAGLAANDYRQATEGFVRLDNATKLQTVLDYASTLTAQNPTNSVAHMLKGDALARVGKYAEALVELDHAVRLDAHAAPIFNTRGTIRAMAAQTTEAMADFEQALALAPDFADAHANVGLSHLAFGDAATAIKHFSRAIALAPDFALAYNGRGTAYAWLGAWDAAVGNFAQAAALLPSLAFPQSNAQLLARQRTQFAFRQSLPRDENDNRGTTLVAQSYEHLREDVGNGQAIDVFIIKATPQTSTFEGMKTVVRDITQRLRTQK